MPEANFSPALFDFIRDLKANNHRDWFQANKARYEDDVVDPALRFISDVGPGLREISPHLLAIPKKVGGSMFRIYRDVRFSKNKNPYKTNIGMHFRHELAKDVHAPGYYVHIQPPSVGNDYGMTGSMLGVLITDHSVRETLGICDHAYILNDGQVLAEGEPEAILQNEEVRDVYLGKEFTL